MGVNYPGGGSDVVWGTPHNFWWECVAHFSNFTLTLFQSKMFNFLYPFSDLICKIHSLPIFKLSVQNGQNLDPFSDQNHTPWDGTYLFI